METHYCGFFCFNRYLFIKGHIIMKIRLTESQYSRLLKEDEISYDDNILNRTSIGDKITLPIAKVFLHLYKSNRYPFDTSYIQRENPLNDSNFDGIVVRIIDLLGITMREAIVLGHNYCSVYNNEIDEAMKSGDLNGLIGKPLQFYGKFIHPTTMYYHGYVTGWANGNAEVYATDLEMFEDKLNRGLVELDNSNDDIEYDPSNTDFEPDWDFTYDNLRNIEIEKDLITIEI